MNVSNIICTHETTPYVQSQVTSFRFMKCIHHTNNYLTVPHAHDTIHSFVLNILHYMKYEPISPSDGKAIRTEWEKRTSEYLLWDHNLLYRITCEICMNKLFHSQNLRANKLTNCVQIRQKCPLVFTIRPFLYRQIIT